MSASREKKQRRDSDAPKLSSRALEEQAKAAKRKRNTIVYSIIGAVVVILAAILLIWDSGVIQRNRTVATIDGEKVTAAQVAYYYYDNDILQWARFYAQWAQYGLSGYPYSLSQSPREQVITADIAAQLLLDDEYVGKTFHDYFLDCALDSLRQEYALCAAAKEAGYILSDEGKEEVATTLATIDSGRDSYLSTYGVSLNRSTYLQMSYGDSMTYRAFRTCLENEQLAAEFKDAHLDTLADYSDAELDAYYQEHVTELNNYHYYSQLFTSSVETTTDEDGNTVEPTEEEEAAALAEAKEEAEAALAEVQGKLDAVRDNEDFTEFNKLLATSSVGYEWLTDAERQPGDATVLEDDNGYYLLVFEESYLSEATADVRHILVSAMMEDDPDTEEDESKADPTDEAFDAAKQTALDLLEQWKANGATEEAFAALAEEYSADAGSKANGGLYEDIYVGNDFLPAFLDWSLDPARQSGDVSDPIQNTKSSTQGWHLIYFVNWKEPIWKSTVREALWVNDLKANTAIERTDRLDSYFA